MYLLAVSHGIMALHHGTLSVHSEGEGHGCTFTMTIPCADADEPDISGTVNALLDISGGDAADIYSPPDTLISPLSADSRQMYRRVAIEEKSCDGYSGLLGTVRSSSSQTSQLPLHGTVMTAVSSSVTAPQPSFSVLVVDDVDMGRKMVCRLLARRGFVCAEAVDGLQAVEKVRSSLVDDHNKSYDVILMDYEMPNLSGPDAVQRIRALGYGGLVIGLTGHVGTVETDAFISHGANDVLTKPLDVSALMRYLALSRR